MVQIGQGARGACAREVLVLHEGRQKLVGKTGQKVTISQRPTTHAANEAKKWAGPSSRASQCCRSEVPNHTGTHFQPTAVFSQPVTFQNQETRPLRISNPYKAAAETHQNHLRGPQQGYLGGGQVPGGRVAYSGNRGQNVANEEFPPNPSAVFLRIMRVPYALKKPDFPETLRFVANIC